MQRVGDFIGRHVGLPALICGGGPSLLAGYQAAPLGAVRFGVNFHAVRAGLVVDYQVHLDTVEAWEEHELTAAPRIGHAKTAPDIALQSWVPDYGNSAPVAAWVAQIMGCDPVVVTGCDCYTGAVPYAWDVEAHPRGESLRDMCDRFGPMAHKFVARWQRFLATCPRPERVFVTDGPLLQAGFQAWPGARG